MCGVEEGSMIREKLEILRFSLKGELRGINRVAAYARKVKYHLDWKTGSSIFVLEVKYGRSAGLYNSYLLFFQRTKANKSIIYKVEPNFPDRKKR